MVEQISPESKANLEAYRTADAVDYYSFYRLFLEEKYLFAKYYKAGESILDLACGLGRTTLLLHEMGVHVRGIDRSEIFVNTARRRLPYLDLRIGSFDKIDESDSSFSHVLISLNSIDLSYPLTHRLTALRECVRVLKPGGTFIFSSHNVRSLRFYSPYYLGRLKWKMRFAFKSFSAGTYVNEDDQYIYFSSPDTVVRQTEGLGLKLLEMESSTFQRTGIKSVDRHFAPYIYFAFQKPPV